jgi:hypothetical protein
MRKAVNLSAALSAVAAMVGAGFASGRELVVFFAGQGTPSWLGVLIACAGAGFLTGAVAALSRRTGRRDLPGVFSRTIGRGSGTSRCGDLRVASRPVRGGDAVHRREAGRADLSHRGSFRMRTARSRSPARLS